tara:strand:+ start:146 stop:484 length:339 start_codon:yes stop_codon:yes gene_type:complete
MYSFRNIALLSNLVLIVFVSVVYFDSVKLFVKYDSYIHFIMYFSLGLLSIDLNQKRRLSYKIIFIILIPVLTEYIQDYIPSRRHDIEDVYFSYLGLLSGLIVYLIYFYVKKT